MRKSSARGYSGRAAALGQAGQAQPFLIFFTAWKYLCKTSSPSSFPLIRAPWVPTRARGTGRGAEPGSSHLERVFLVKYLGTHGLCWRCQGTHP